MVTSLVLSSLNILMIMFLLEKSERELTICYIESFTTFYHILVSYERKIKRESPYVDWHQVHIFEIFLSFWLLSKVDMNETNSVVLFLVLFNQ